MLRCGLEGPAGSQYFVAMRDPSHHDQERDFCSVRKSVAVGGKEDSCSWRRRFDRSCVGEVKLG